MVYTCSSSWLLADRLSDLSQSEKKITVAKAKQIQTVATKGQLTLCSKTVVTWQHKLKEAYY